MPIETAIKQIIDHHNQELGKAANNTNHNYWHQKLEEVNSNNALQMIDKINHNNHHIGDFYRRNGMKIDLNKDSPEANNLLSVMNFIIDGLQKNNKNCDENPILNKNLFAPQQNLKNQVGEQNLLTKYINSNDNQYKQSRRFAEIDLPEEYEIKAIAVSILAETNGDAKLAQFILNNAGLTIIKSMNVGELNHLKADLQSTVNNQNPNDHNR